MSELDDLLTQAREAGQQARIGLRDPIAAQGEPAIDAMTDWLGDSRLAAFAIRVLQQVGADPAHRAAVIAVLAAVDRAELPHYLMGDLDFALNALGGSGASIGHRSGSGRSTRARAPGSTGTPGRGYWVMRTSPWEPAFIWAEALEGRLRQGWGKQDDQNLEVIAATLQAGGVLNEAQQESRRSLRMLSTLENGMRLGDTIVTPNLPEYGRLSVFRLVGSYVWSPANVPGAGDRFGHLLPVELVIADIDRRAPEVSDGLRAMLRPQTRLYNISGYGGDVERLLGGPSGGSSLERPVDGTGVPDPLRAISAR